MRRTRLWSTLVCACVLGWATPAVADAGVWEVGAQAAWMSVAQAQLTANAQLGLADAWAWHVEAGLRLNNAAGLRPEVATGVTWAYDVASYVPAATLAAGLTYPDGQVSPLGLARLELRRFVTPHAWAAVLVGAEVTRAGWAASVGLGFCWQLVK